jgi:crossover junction endodeoxyribonuclease RuvC
VLGIDPGLSACGYGAVRRDGGTLAVVACGVLRTDRALDLPERLARLEHELACLVAELRPSAVAVERVLFQSNVRTAISVGQASGLALAVAARAGVAVVQYSPNEVKLAVTGDGRADKGQVQAMVARLLHLDAPPRPPDVADALALAVCHAWRRGLDRGLERATAGRGGNGLARAVDAALARDGARGAARAPRGRGAR